jgi:hypothetical protein
MATRHFTVACAEHGPMARDPNSPAWQCTDGDCGRRISDGEVFRQVTGTPGDSSDPVALMVTYDRHLGLMKPARETA